MPRRKRRRANWPYRLSWFVTLGGILAYVGIQTLVRGAATSRPGMGIDWQLALVSSLLDATCAIWFAAVGASIGSFLNVVAYRLPLHRTVGGHSACPYCTCAIAGSDNIPVFAWIKLRGRCRHCRLPISIQYPLVELTVGILFLVVYFTEFATGGANLPGVRLASQAGLLGIGITVPFMLRILVYLFALSGLVAAALIAVKRRVIPMGLFVSCLVPVTVAALVEPLTLIVRWRIAPPVGPLEARLDALTTIICGVVAGIAVARLLAPLVYRNFDRSLMASDQASAGARQFVGAMAVAGAVLGWQAVVPMSWCVLVLGLASVLVLRRTPLNLSGLGLMDLTVWVWLGLLVFRASWSVWDNWLSAVPLGVSPVVGYVVGALLLAPLAILYRQVAAAAVAPGQPKDSAASEPNDSDAEEETDEDQHSSMNLSEQNADGQLPDGQLLDEEEQV